MLGNFLAAAQLAASQEGLSSMELVSLNMCFVVFQKFVNVESHHSI
jgi:hypothetical protein